MNRDPRAYAVDVVDGLVARLLDALRQLSAADVSRSGRRGPTAAPRRDPALDPMGEQPDG